MEKFFLIDAYAIIYRSYYAFIKNPRINSKGLNTSAIVGFMNTINEVLTKEKPTYIAVAFDRGKTFRNEAFPEYKAQREATPEDIKTAVPIIKDLLAAMNICCIEAEGFEADDIIGTLALKAGSQGIETYMLTPDKDYGQLVGGNVYIYRPRHGGGYETLDEKAVCEKHGITTPLQVIDILALMGDSADNFPGCPGIGPKTATQLINQFGSVENLLSHTSELKGKMKEKVEAATDDIKMSKFLATIRTDVPVELDLEKFKIKEADDEKLTPLLSELEFKTLANKIVKKPTAKQKKVNSQPDLFGFFQDEDAETDKNDRFKTLDSTPHEYQLIEDEGKMRDIRDFLLTFEKVVLDTETTSVNAIDAKLVGMSFCVEETKAFYVAVPEDEDKAQAVVEIFRPLLENKEILKIGQNIKYDIQVLRNYGVTVEGEIFDTMIAHYLINPDLQHGMDYMAETMLDYRTIHIEELIGPAGKQQKSMRDLSPTLVYEYACEDADVTMKLYNILCRQIEDNDMHQLCHDIEMPLIRVLADMEYNGVLLDTDALRDTSNVFTQRMLSIEHEIYELAGHSFNISSPRQVGDVLFGEMHIVDKPKKTKTGQFVTSEEELQKHASKHEIIRKILDYRGLKKLIGTYVDALPQLINPRTHHIHTSFNQAVTATGRLSSSNPNLQNIPVRGDDGKEIRKCFIPEAGCKFFSADYSQIELRVMAHLSEDENMIHAFENGLDIHASTAAKVYKKDISEVTRDERTKAKRANFGIIYGITTWGLAESLLIDRQEAKALMEGYFETFPRVKDYMERAKEEVRQKGYAETFFHRRRYLPDINSANATVRGFAERNAINAPIQGSAADIIKLAMVRIFNRFKAEGIRSKMILQVHDELNFSVFPDEEEKVERIVLEEMQGAYALRVPLIADSGWGCNWLEAH